MVAEWAGSWERMNVNLRKKMQTRNYKSKQNSLRSTKPHAAFLASSRQL